MPRDEGGRFRLPLVDAKVPLRPMDEGSTFEPSADRPFDARLIVVVARRARSELAFAGLLRDAIRDSGVSVGTNDDDLARVTPLLAIGIDDGSRASSPRWNAMRELLDLVITTPSGSLARGIASEVMTRAPFAEG